MCLSALFWAGRHQEVIDLVSTERIIWNYKEWAAKSLAALGKNAEAIQYAERCRSPWASDAAIDSLCEEILLSSGKADDAYDCYALRANQRGTFLATFRAVTNRYPHKSAREILADLARTTPGDEGKWFATAKDAGLLDEAIALARRSPSDPKTLARAARDFAEDEPGFALQSGLLSLHWLVQGYGYELTSADVWMA